jgi:photosystem II stability/assembly factor-like uncharacterized protein
MRKLWVTTVAALALALVAGGGIPDALWARQGDDRANIVVDPSAYDGMTYRSLGFSRGGRATAVAGVPSEPLTFYFGATGGGVWKTTNGGIEWTNVSDGFLDAGSIGAVSVAESDPNVVYVGTGSACPRGNVSAGIGMYRSLDAGGTWTYIGLCKDCQIGRIRVHPKDPDLVYAAVLGNVFGPSPDRGVYRSKDGGATWEKVLYVNERTGASDLAMDATNPRVLYAGMWAIERKPWTIDSGSLDGGIFKSTDGGDHWTKLSGGLPTDVLVGKIGVTVSPADPGRVWALVEAADDKGGVYRSDDGGKTWQRTNSQRMLQQRAWYYTHIYADPKSRNTVYALNTGFYRSTDGGRTFEQFSVPHGDNHDLWINPNDPQIMINSNDGGANVSLTGGTSWTDQMGQPTAEFYRLTVDNRWPYRVYGAQQDNSTASVSSAGGGRGGASFYDVGGGESGHIAVDPRNPNIVYAGSYGGVFTRVDVGTGLEQSIRPYPDLETGLRAADMKYRFQWNAPIRISPHNPDVIYVTSQVVHRSMDQGRTWEVISPDLTRNDKSKQDYSGGEGITRDSTGVEVYDTIFAFEESPVTAGELWAGSDDGMVHLSRDNGKTWQDITPHDMPAFGVVNMIDLSTTPGRATIAVYRYRQNDFAPYVFQTSDYGKTWKRLTNGSNGIPADHFVRVVREDPARQGLLYAGTEYGMYVSFDAGAHWQEFQLNLPIVPVTDLMLYRDNLVVSTQGRAFWALDDLAPVRQAQAGMEKTNTLFKPSEAYRSLVGPASIYYYLADAPKGPVRIEITDAKGTAVASFTGRPGQEGPVGPPTGRGRFGGGPPRVPAAKGLNHFTWNMRYASLFEIPRGTVLWAAGGSAGPNVVPGTYQVKVTAGSWSATQPLEVKADPRVSTSTADYEAQLKLAREVGTKIKEIYDAIGRIRDIKQQATELGNRMQKAGFGDEVAQAAKALNDKLGGVEGQLTQLQGEGGQDALNFPGQLDNQFLVLYGNVNADDVGPSAGMASRFAELTPQLSKLQDQLKQILDTDLVKFNDLVRGKGAGPVIIKS